MKKSVIVLCLAIAILPGCASQLQAVKAFNASAVVSLKAAEDVNLERLQFEMCATPYSAIIRHPELVPGMAAMCLPGGNLTNPANLLTGIPAVVHQ